MREAVFMVRHRPNGGLTAECHALRLCVSATDHEQLQEEARDALINAVGPAHMSYRVQMRRPAQHTAR
jgi:hypothetical protein